MKPIERLGGFYLGKEVDPATGDLKAQLAADAEDVAARWEEQLDELTTYAVKPRRTDVRADLVALAWAPFWEIGPDFDRSPDRLEGWR